MTIGVRLALSLIIATSVVAGGVALERSLGVRASRSAPTSEDVSGAWYCPHGGGEGWTTWVTVANPSAAPADVRIETHVGQGIPRPVDEVVEPRSLRTFEVPAPQTASGTVVEYFGTAVGAGTASVAPDGGLAAEPCSARARTRWYVPEGSTLRSETSSVVVMNPFAADAVVDVAVVGGERTLHPGPLKGVVLAPGEVRAFDLSRYALGEEALGAVVTAPLGRVSVAGLGTSRGGIRAVLGVGIPSARRILPGADAAGGSLVVLAPQDRPVPIGAQALGPDGEAPIIDLENVDPGTAMGFDEAPQTLGVVVEAQGHALLVAGGRQRVEGPAPKPEEPARKEKGKGKAGETAGGGAQEDRQAGGGTGGMRNEKGAQEPPPEPPPGDQASTAGTARPRGSWLVLPAVAPGGGGGALVLLNPTPAESAVSLTFLGEGGPVEGGREVVQAGAALMLGLPDRVAVLVRATSGAVVPAQLAREPTRFAVSVGLPY